MDLSAPGVTARWGVQRRVSRSPVGGPGVLVVDAQLGPATRQSVVEFQQRYGLVADGVTGPQTWNALVVTAGDRSRGEAVAAAQAQLQALGHDVEVDGKSDEFTEAAVAEFQGVNDLDADGAVGPVTWNALLRRSGR